MQYNHLHIKNDIAQIAHSNTFYFLRYVHFRYVECLFSNIQKQYNTLKSSLFFEKNINFPGKQLENSKDSECNIFRILSLYEHKHMERFSNLHYCTFKRIKNKKICSFRGRSFMTRKKYRNCGFLEEFKVYVNKICTCYK